MQNNEFLTSAYKYIKSLEYIDRIKDCRYKCLLHSFGRIFLLSMHASNLFLLDIRDYFDEKTTAYPTSNQNK